MKARRVLAPLSALYGVLQRRDRARKERDAWAGRLPVIAIGNISVGGSGKTPLVERLMTALGKEYPVLVLSRGYRRRSRADVIWRCGDPLPDPMEFGDEPAMLARTMQRALGPENAPGSGVAVGADRAALLRTIEREFADAVVLADDAFQHYRLRRDLDIVIVDDRTASNPWLLPAGDLREPPEALKRAGVVLATSDAAELFARRHAGAGAEVFRMKPAHSLSTPEGLAIDAAVFSGERFLAVAGIARPDRVLASARALGLDVPAMMAFRDHHRYTERDVARIEARMRRHGATRLVTTAKDAVKLEAFRQLRQAMCVVRVEMRIENEARLMSIVRGCIQRKRSTE